MKTEKRKIGDIGEETALNHLKRLGFSLVEKNYLRKWGEIDLIVKKDKVIHFIEVKTVSREITNLKRDRVSHETHYRPEENVSPEKLKKLGRAIQTWISDNEYEGEWQMDVAAVLLDREERRGRITLIENVLLEQ